MLYQFISNFIFLALIYAVTQYCATFLPTILYQVLFGMGLLLVFQAVISCWKKDTLCRFRRELISQWVCFSLVYFLCARVSKFNSLDQTIMLYQIVYVMHYMLAFSIILLVLSQQGKGAEMGATFGSGASTSLFGSQGSDTFVAKIIGFLAFIFMLTSIILSVYVNKIKPSKLQKELIAVAEKSVDEPASKGISVEK